MSKEKLITYFIERTDKRFDTLEKKIDGLSNFKWQVIGVASTMIILAGIILKGF